MQKWLIKIQINSNSSGILPFILFNFQIARNHRFKVSKKKLISSFINRVLRWNLAFLFDVFISRSYLPHSRIYELHHLKKCQLAVKMFNTQMVQCVWFVFRFQFISKTICFIVVVLLLFLILFTFTAYWFYNVLLLIVGEYEKKNVVDILH